MKTTEEILRYIENYYEQATERPFHFFRNLRCMEDQLTTLETLYEFIIDDAGTRAPKTTGYTEYLIQNGYGSFGFPHGKVKGDAGDESTPIEDLSETEVSQMRELAQFWRAFLASDRRLRPLQ